MGNCQSCSKCCKLLCPEEENGSINSEESTDNLFTSIYNYPSHYVNDLRLQKGDILEVIAENEQWLYVKKSNVVGIEEKGNVPRDFLRPAKSLEANL